MELINWGLEQADKVPEWVPSAIGVAAAVALLGLAVFLIYRAITARARAIRRAAQHADTGRRTNLKLELGFAIVQAGLSVATIQGVYEFFHSLLDMPTFESVILAVFIEGTIWTLVGFIIDHGRTVIEVRGTDGATVKKHATGWGIAGPFFWIATLSAGALAIIASTPLVAVGRAIIVVVGTAMWVLRLMRATHRPERRSRFRFTPYRIAVAWGWIEPDPMESEADQNREWRIQRLARAIRLANSGTRLVTWWGNRSLTKMAEETTPDILRAAQSRFAAAFLLREQAKAGSEVMRAVIASERATTVGLAQLGEQAAINEARRVLTGQGAGAGGKRPPNVDDQQVPDRVDQVDDQVDDNTVKPIAGQFAKDQAAATTIVAIMAKLTPGVVYATWDDLRAAVRDGKLLRAIERESQKNPATSMGKPRVTRILNKAHTLFDVPPVLEEAKSA